MTTVYSSSLHQVLSELSARNTCMACFPMLTTSNKVTASTTSPFCSWLTLLLLVEFLLMFSHCFRTFRFSLWNESSKQSMWANTTHNRHSQIQVYFPPIVIISPGCSVLCPKDTNKSLPNTTILTGDERKDLPLWILLSTMNHKHRKV